MTNLPAARNLLAWLETAITTRENALKAVREGRRWYVDPSDGHVAEPDGLWDDGRDRLPNRHGIWTPLFDPADALRVCARDRKLLELHGGRHHDCPVWDEDGDLDQEHFYDHEVCPVVQGIADGYGWKEDVTA